MIDDRFPHIKEVLIDSYDEILTSRDSIVNLYRKAIGGWSRSLDREVEWAKITGFFSDASKLDRQHKNSIKEYNRVIDAVNELDELQYWTTDSRREDLDFIENAIKNGASKIICEKDIDFDIPYEKVEDTDKYLREILHKEYGEKLNEMKLIGVTGTNGKTTSCYLTYQMLLNMGVDAAYIGTIGYYHKDEHIELNNTTPDILTVYKLLMNAYESGAKTVVMEVSSQGLSHKRVEGFLFDYVVFTNLTQDHLDYHKSDSRPFKPA